MSTQSLVQVTFGGISTEYSNKGFTHESITVAKTATMANGSALVAAGTEAAIADVADVTGVIDDPAIELADEGDSVLVAVATRGCIFNTDAISFSDAGALVPSAATILNTALNIFK